MSIDEFNNYYKLKTNYDSEINKEKRKISNNISFSIKDKRREFQKIKPKCINCKRPVGTIFLTTFETTLDSRILKAKCGKISDPCNLDIEIVAGVYGFISNIVSEVEDDIHTNKNKLIDDKNKLLFGYVTTKQVLDKFEVIKNTINDQTSDLELYLGEYNNIIDNTENKIQINKYKEQIYATIISIKNLIIDFNTSQDSSFIQNAVRIYIDELQPLLQQLLELKYKKNIVEFNTDTNTYHLIQQKYTMEDIEIPVVDYEIKKFEIGFKETIKKKSINEGDKELNKIKIKISSDSSEEESEEEESEEEESEEEENKPIFSSDGRSVSWKNPDYIKVWNNLNNTYQQILLTDHNWLEETIHEFVNKNKLKQKKIFIQPTNLIIPPKLEGGKYNFGNKAYNDIFNNLEELQKKVFISFSNNSLLDSINNIIKKKINFDQLQYYKGY